MSLEIYQKVVSLDLRTALTYQMMRGFKYMTHINLRKYPVNLISKTLGKTWDFDCFRCRQARIQKFPLFYSTLTKKCKKKSSFLKENSVFLS